MYNEFKQTIICARNVVKKKLSLFWTIILIILPLVILIDILAIFSAYNYARETTYEHYRKDIASADEIANELLRYFNLKDPENGTKENSTLSMLCENLDLPYLYVIEVDEQAGTIKYLCIGTGKDASYEFKKTGTSATSSRSR